MYVGVPVVRCDVSVSSSNGTESLLQTPDMAQQIQVSERHTNIWNYFMFNIPFIS